MWDTEKQPHWGKGIVPQVTIAGRAGDIGENKE
jgi:hypothetical protein